MQLKGVESEEQLKLKEERYLSLITSNNQASTDAIAQTTGINELILPSHETDFRL